MAIKKINQADIAWSDGNDFQFMSGVKSNLLSGCVTCGLGSRTIMPINKSKNQPTVQVVPKNKIGRSAARRLGRYADKSATTNHTSIPTTTYSAPARPNLSSHLLVPTKALILLNNRTLKFIHGFRRIIGQDLDRLMPSFYHSL